MQKKPSIIEALVRSHLVAKNLDAGYRQMAHEEAREAEALEWAEATLGDVADEAVRYGG